MKIGDIVYLKSGSPPLTVCKIGNFSREIAVSWINDHFFREEMTAPRECFQTSVPAFNLGVP